MRQVLIRLALATALFALTCGGTIAQSAQQPATGVDSCAAARPNFGGTATAADRALFAYDVDAPLNLKKTVESTTKGVEVSAISFSSPDGGRVTGMMWDPVEVATVEWRVS